VPPFFFRFVLFLDLKDVHIEAKWLGEFTNALINFWKVSWSIIHKYMTLSSFSDTVSFSTYRCICDCIHYLFIDWLIFVVGLGFEFGTSCLQSIYFTAWASFLTHFPWLLWRWHLMNYLPRLASNRDPSDLSLQNSQDYGRKSLASSLVRHIDS
jgi:hypothetical protein